jgi:hypothetical protein
MRYRRDAGPKRLRPDLTWLGAAIAALLIVALVVWVASQVSGAN